MSRRAMSNRSAAILAIVSANLLGGISYIWTKIACDCGIPVFTLTALRSLVATALLAMWIRPTLRWVRTYSRTEWVRLISVSLLGFAIPATLGNIGVDMSSAGNGSILILMEPTAILFFSWLFLREQVRAVQLTGFALGLGGAFLVTIGNTALADVLGDLKNQEYLQGNVILLIHGVLWGLYSPLIKPLASKHRTMGLTFAVMLIGTVPMIPAAIYLEYDQWQWTDRTWEGLGYVLLLGVLVSLLTTILWNFSLRTLNASMVAPFIFLQPVVGCVAGYFLLGESLSTTAAFGAVLIGFAVLLVNAPRRRRHPAG